MSQTAAATPTKLRSGDWGARVSGRVSRGDTITITTRKGKSWTATVEHVIWTGQDRYGDGEISIVATASAGRRRTHRSSHRNSESCGYPCPVTGRRCTPSDPCHDCL